MLALALTACGSTQTESVVESADNKKTEITKKWWKESTIYQIYPRSFKDSDGNGVGDIPGIISELDYLQDLGADVVWLSPVYKSPNDDNGYDISDYQDIMDEFGTMADFDKMLAEMKKRDLKLIMDLVVNHSSDEHEWFKSARESVDSPYRDYYIWRKPVNGKAPNNWKSFFGGSAWEYDEKTGEYYLHLFSKKQPDLNWENPKLRQEVYKMMRFWLDKGVDGFRMDVIPFISKKIGLPDLDYSNLPGGLSAAYANGPRLHEFLHEMNQEVMSHYDVFAVGEAPGVTPEIAPLYVGEDRKELDMIFHFQHLKIDRDKNNIWKKIKYPLAQFKDIFQRWDDAIGTNGWGTVYLGNHDTARIVSHFGDDKQYREESAKMLATMLFTLRGTVGVYQGDELGMTNRNFSSISQFRDIQALNAYQEIVVEKGNDEQDFIHSLNDFSRDHARTPMHWSDKKNAGFTNGTPWIGLNENYPMINAEQQKADKNSVLNYYKQLIKLRKSTPLYVYGETEILHKEDNNIYAYVRQYQGEASLVVLNFSGDKQVYTLSEKWAKKMKDSSLAISNYSSTQGSAILNLKPYEARVYKL